MDSNININIELSLLKLKTILDRFHNKFKYRKNTGKKKPILDYEFQNIHVIDIKIKQCVYTNSINDIKQNLIVKYYIYDQDTSIISLNLLFDDYKDIIYNETT
jgi:hypothetical protein